ncbi:MAG: ABC transporter ATP-binding protein [Spirochaetota bacterium]
MIRVENISASYGSTAVFRSLSLEIPSGALALVTGKNGTGKSTLCRILSDLKDIDSGSVTVTGTVSLAAPCVVPYGAMTIREIQSLVCDSPEEVSMMNDLFAGMGGVRPVDTVSALSSGALQKLSLSLALSRNANTVILDEPFTHIDSDAVRFLAGHIRTLSSTVLVASHRTDINLQPDIEISLDTRP